MDISILVQILIVVAIIVGLMMIVVLWRTIGVMDDLKSASDIILRRVREIDQAVEDTKEKISSFSEMVKNFVLSFEFVKSLKEKMEKGSSCEPEKENHG